MNLGDDYISSYTDTPFYNDKNDNVAYVSNAMWHMFGAVDDGQNLVYKYGAVSTWYEWLIEKAVWCDDSVIETMKTLIADSPQVDNGFMWNWTDRIEWRVADHYTLHYDGTFRYINAVYDIIKWENSTEYLNTTDTTAATSDRNKDWSRNKTVYEKTEQAMEYLLNNLGGKDGIIHITEDSVYMSNGEKMSDCWNNTGKLGSNPSNYWDNLCFGNYDAYEDALFYNSLNAMAGIERMLGNSEKAVYYENLMQTVKKKYDEYFYNTETGRYVGCVDTDGVMRDYGLTFVNFEALKYGLGNSEKASSIFDWIDGKRTVNNDTSTGEDIFKYKIAARTNTVAIESVSDNGVYWWNGPGNINVENNSSYGHHLENGGYIFFETYYELMARASYFGGNGVITRLQEIADDYENNGRLNHDVCSDGYMNWEEGLIGEYPENGLVPATYLYGLLGIDAYYGGLKIAPAYNTAYEYAGVNKIVYGGTQYKVEINKNGKLTVTGTNRFSANINYKPVVSTKSYKVTLRDANGSSLINKTVSADENGYINVDLSGSGAVDVTARLDITPIV